MSFFKKIGKSIKKATKQISFKNVVKIASKFDPTGIVGGIQDAHYAKKEEQKALAEQKAAEDNYAKELAANNQAAAEMQKKLIDEAVARAKYQQELLSANTQAVGGKIGVVAGSIGGDITKQALQTASQNINKDLQTGISKAGANLANSTMNEWLKIHWWKLLLGLVGIGVILRLFLGGKRR